MKNKLIIGSLFITIAFISCKQDKKTNDTQSPNKETSVSDKKEQAKETVSPKIKDFSWNDIPESTIDIGVYPYITPPKGMKIDKNTSDTKSYEFHKLEMFDGNTIINIKGRVEMMGIQMDSYKENWNQFLFDESVDEYLKSIGAVLISDKKISEEIINSWGETPNEKYAHMHNFYVGDVINDKVKMYLLRTPNKKIGFQVYSNTATGNIGIVEQKDFNQTIEKITADDIFKAINDKGFATLHINFDTGKSKIKADSYGIVNEISKMLKSNPELKISIEGHTDNVGDESSNMELSKNRAKAVLMAIIDEGIDKSRLKSEGFGQTKPIGSNETEEGKAQNRRVELRKL
ncbi:OmpA family protein [Tenacibaculum sp. ZS6-P6]|uniref:OmpA family protein n=1 Tax=Tenacibaculum sp. ZS6-P6 TaxID=3447503 RepID=UPI003F97D657